MQHIAPILEKALKRRKFYQKMMLAELKKEWPQVVGDLSDGTEPVSVRRKRIIVRCDHSCYAWEISLLESTISSFLRERGYQGFVGIKTEVGRRKNG